MSRPGLFASGGFHGLVVTIKGQLITWGRNTHGQVGDGTITDKMQPVCLRETGAFRVGAGEFHSLLVTDVGEVWAWGLNENGRLGCGCVIKITTPTKIISEGAVAVDGGLQHSLALTKDGNVLAWGGNEYGQIGDGSTEDRREPTLVFRGATAIAAGHHHSVALGSDGAVYAWGFTTDDQTCHSAAVTPVRIGLTGIQDIFAGGYHTLALSEPTSFGSGGILYAWGGNTYGQLGDGSSTRRLIPLEIADDIKQASAGTMSSAAVTMDGRLFIWGYGFYGPPDEVGKWKSLWRPTFVDIEGGVHSVHCGTYHRVLLNFSGEILTFGGNMMSQLGNGNTVDKGFPRVMLKAGTVEITRREDVIAALMKAPDEMSAEELAAQEEKKQAAGAVKLVLSQPGLLPPRYCEQVMMKSDYNMEVWQGGLAPQGYQWWKRMHLAEPNETAGLVRPGYDKPGEGEAVFRQEQARNIQKSERELEIATESLEKSQAGDARAAAELKVAAAALKAAKAAMVELEAQEERKLALDAFNNAPPKRGAKKPPPVVNKGDKLLDRTECEMTLRKCEEDYRQAKEERSEAAASLAQENERLHAAKEALKSAKGNARLPDVLDLMIKGESEFTRKIRLRKERQRADKALKEEEEAFKLQLERVKKAARADPRLQAMKMSGPFRVAHLAPFSDDRLMLMFKSCLGDMIRSSIALEPGETKWIKDKAIYQLLQPVWKPILIVQGILITHWPKHHYPPEPHGTIKQMPWRLPIIGIDENTWCAEELDDMRGMSSFGLTNKIIENEEWLVTLYGTEGTDPSFHVPKPYGKLPPIAQPPEPEDEYEWGWDEPPDLLRQLADMGLGGGAASVKEMTTAHTATYFRRAGPVHKDLELSIEEIEARFFKPLEDHESLREFKYRVCEGLSLLHRLGFPLSQQEIDKHFSGASTRKVMRETLGFRRRSQ